MILASASPRRRDLLSEAGFKLTIAPADVDETPLPDESPIELVRRLATNKAYAAYKTLQELPEGEVVLGADTIVWTPQKALGKPLDAADARRMLSELSGATHHVSTGVCLIAATSSGVVTRSFVETTDVSFRKLSEAEIDAYVKTGEPLDKAGAYGIQGGAGAFVDHICGDYNNVVGLPVERVVRELTAIS